MLGSLVVFGLFLFSGTQLRVGQFSALSAENNEKEPKKTGIDFSNLVQLMTMGAGAPSLGEYQRTDENGKMFFELEANNFVDSEGVR
jgi:hypothetical protein